MRILHFSHKPVYPKIDGGCIAIADSIERLQKISSNQITHVCLSTHKHPLNKESYSLSNPNLKEVRSFEINTKLNPVSALASLIKGTSYNVTRFYNKSVEEELEKILSNAIFDLIWLESIFTLPYLPLFKKFNIPVLVRTHNIEHRIWKELARNTSNPFKKIYIKKLASQLEKFELNTLEKVDGIACISESDAAYFNEKLSSPKIETILTSQILSQEKANYELKTVFHLAAMDWLPNKEGLSWFVSEVMPHLKEGVSVHIAGKALAVEDYTNENLINHGEIPVAEDFIHKHGICIIPLQSGSGIRMKVLQNLAQGKPIVSTSKGVEGLNLSQEELCIQDDPVKFAMAINNLVDNLSERKQKGTASQLYIQENFSPEKIEKQIIEFIEKI